MTVQSRSDQDLGPQPTPRGPTHVTNCLTPQASMNYDAKTDIAVVHAALEKRAKPRWRKHISRDGCTPPSGSPGGYDLPWTWGVKHASRGSGTCRVKLL
ncbi:unnamed protein product, partial [Scytosiphon promiscuus]